MGKHYKNLEVKFRSSHLLFCLGKLVFLQLEI